MSDDIQIHSAKDIAWYRKSVFRLCLWLAQVQRFAERDSSFMLVAKQSATRNFMRKIRQNLALLMVTIFQKITILLGFLLKMVNLSAMQTTRQSLRQLISGIMAFQPTLIIISLRLPTMLYAQLKLKFKQRRYILRIYLVKMMVLLLKSRSDQKYV